MKTNTINSIVAVLGVTVALNLSALAGPGVQQRFQASNTSAQKSVAKSPTVAFGGTQSSASQEIPYVSTTQGRVSAPTAVQAVGPHGNTILLYRW